MPQGEIYPGTNMELLAFVKYMELTIASPGNILGFDANVNVCTSCQVSSVINAYSQNVTLTAKNAYAAVLSWRFESVANVAGGIGHIVAFCMW